MLISLSLVGCATDGMNAAMGIGAISSSKTTFDNATHVDMTPAFLTDGKGNNRTQLGAKWISTMPDKVCSQFTTMDDINADFAAFAAKGGAVSI